jgi:hypothetical protein
MTKVRTPDEEAVNCAELARKVVTSLIPAVDPESTGEPAVQESYQCYQEAQEVVNRANSQGSSGEAVLDELMAWAEDRPLPTLDARRRSLGFQVDRPTVVADSIHRSGVLTQGDSP